MKVVITEILTTEKKKSGEFYEFNTVKVSLKVGDGRLISGMVPARHPSTEWKVGDKVDINITQNNGFWNWSQI